MRKSCASTFSAKKGPRESQHPAAKKVLSVDSSKPGLARLSLVVNVFSSRDAGTTIKPSMTDLDLRTVSVLEILRLAQARGDKSPSPKISPEISPPCAFKKSSNFKDLRKISPISPISPPPQGYFARRLYS